MSSGVAALAAARILGRRHIKEGETALQPHSLMIVLLGAGLLWFGWFGFNGGSALAADGVAVHAPGQHQRWRGSRRFDLALADMVPNSKAQCAGHGLRRDSRPGSRDAPPPVTSLPCQPSSSASALRSFPTSPPRAASTPWSTMPWTFGQSMAWPAPGAAWRWVFSHPHTLASGGLLSGNNDFFIAQVVSTIVVWIFAYAVTWVIFRVIEAAIGLRPHARGRGAGSGRGRARRNGLHVRNLAINTPLRLPACACAAGRVGRIGGRCRRLVVNSRKSFCFDPCHRSLI